MERLDRNLDRIVEGVEAKVQKFHQQVSGINPTEMISAVNRAPETCLHKIRTVFAEVKVVPIGSEISSYLVTCSFK